VDLQVAPRRLTPRRVKSFRARIYRYYANHGRVFPWRKTRNPYRILVSEIILQQTQTRRVTAKYEEFIRTFPDFAALAKAPLRSILKVWQGLGYNRRAQALKRIAQLVVAQYDGTLPSSRSSCGRFRASGRQPLQQSAPSHLASPLCS